MPHQNLAAKVTLGEAGAVEVPASILGHNIEVTEKNVLGMTNDRLENAKFSGPQDINGFSHPWRANMDFYAAFRPQIDTGVSLSGESSQLLHSFAKDAGRPQAMVQTHRPIRAGERLVAVLWARIRYEAVDVTVGLRPVSWGAKKPYAAATITVDTTFWKRYEVELNVPSDDSEAVFFTEMSTDGMVWIDQVHLYPAGAGAVNSDVVDIIESLRVPVLRFPGGCVATNYDWRSGTGPVELRPSRIDTANNRLISYDFGTDEYLELCFSQGITPHLTVNIGSSTPEDAAAWARYVADWYRDRGVEPPTAYFQVGAEENGIHEFSSTRPELFAHTLRAYVPAIRAAHPAAKIVALAALTSETLVGEKAPWREVVLPLAKELEIELLSIHLYLADWRADGYEQQRAVTGQLGHARGQLDRLIQDCEDAAVASKVAITEWNLLMDSAHYDTINTNFERSGARMAEHYDAIHCLFAAGMIQMFADRAHRVGLANFYHLINGMGVIQHHGIDVREAPIAKVFRLYRDALPGRHRAVTVESPAVEGTEEQCLAALSVTGPELNHLFLVNRSPDASLEVEIDGIEGEPGAMVALAAATPRDDIAEIDTIAWDSGTVVLPPLSIVRISHR